MSVVSPTGPVLFERLVGVPDASGPLTPRALRTLGAALAASLVLAVSSKLSIPIGPVPISLQSLVVVMLGAILGPRRATLAVAFYLVEGAVGLPVFAGTPEKGLGLAYMAGPTGGYLAGFLGAAWVTGHLARRGWDRSVLRATLAMLAGHAVIFAFGLAWLGTVIGWDRPVVAIGLTPFLIGTLAKSLVAAVALPVAWRMLAPSSGSGASFR